MKKLNAYETIQQLLSIVPASRQDFLRELQEKVSCPCKRILMEQIRKNSNAPLLALIRAHQDQGDDLSDSGVVI